MMSAPSASLAPLRRTLSPLTHRHGQRQDEGRQEEEEERPRLSSEVRHEVDDDVEDDGVHDLVGQVSEHGSVRFGRRVIQGVSRVLFDNWTLGVECQDLAEGKSKNQVSLERLS